MLSEQNKWDFKGNNLKYNKSITGIGFVYVCKIGWLCSITG